MQGDNFLLHMAALPLAGLHNAANALAALALCYAIGLPLPQLVEGLRSFKGLPHRVEKIAEINGIAYYDDSKGTNVGATVAALEGIGGQLNHLSSVGGEGSTLPPRGNENDRNSHLPPAGREAGREDNVLPPRGNENDRKIVLIAGGDGKGQEFSPLREAVMHHARCVVLIGRDGPMIGQVLASCEVPLLQAADMEEAVRLATGKALPGDVVLLSPACASFDMYRNYVQRAEAFCTAVLALRPTGAAA